MGPPVSRDDSHRLDVTPDILRTVADEWTRRALRSLYETERDTIPLEELAEQVASEHSEPLPDGNRTAKLRLHHVSLPKLDQHGLVEYDWESNVVRNPPEKRLPDGLTAQLDALVDD